MRPYRTHHRRLPRTRTRADPHVPWSLLTADGEAPHAYKYERPWWPDACRHQPSANCARGARPVSADSNVFCVPSGRVRRPGPVGRSWIMRHGRHPASLGVRCCTRTLRIPPPVACRVPSCRPSAVDQALSARTEPTSGGVILKLLSPASRAAGWFHLTFHAPQPSSCIASISAGACSVSLPPPCRRLGIDAECREMHTLWIRAASRYSRMPPLGAVAPDHTT